MEPSTDLPATPEPAAHIAHAANPTPSHGPNHNHPPYAEMITAAISALNDKKGSSRRSIAKYIDKKYSNLPPTHSALLTHHLRRLKSNGLLVMVKHSYKLPRSVPVPLPPANTSTANPSSSGPKRGPGRPPKPKPEVQPNAGVGPESVLVSLGLLDEPPTKRKRGRGRPPSVKIRSESGEPTLGKRGRGRPPRPKLLSVLMGQDGPKRGRGRPPRTQVMSVLGPGSVSRPRGRPKRDGSSRVKPAGRPRGRPLKNVVVNVAAGVLPVKRPGRPPKINGAKKPRKLTGRPLGRPRKNSSVLAIQESDKQLMAYHDLKFKVEHFQLRIKEVVGIVKSCLTNETAVSALQELELLATTDVSAPLNVEAQEPLLQN